ncbi:MAG: hypothetical protein A2017_19735 [Lentisphaerae bacterium GWF2_44_16]|nr:MAG: hypothetical protein A2017_19735 [Lentisphaerae bacterium GWF2_44_16]
MEDKALKVRNYILDRLEGGELKPGQKLPGAREISGTLKISFMKVQQALEQLVRDGILEAVPRRGTFVQHEWQNRILQSNFTAFKTYFGLPWLSGLEKIFAEKLPQLRVREKFRRSIFELRTTVTVQSESRDYLDLAPIFDKCYPDKSVFFTHPFKTFYINGRLPGIPFIFSPRVMFYNPELLKKAGVSFPRPGWTWDDFLVIVRKLKKTLPSEKIFDWHSAPSLWINIIFRAGACLMDPEREDMVMIDHPRTQYALELLSCLKKELNYDGNRPYPDYVREFCKGELAFFIEPREIMPFIKRSKFKNWATVPIPFIEGGRDISAQATDLICIRNTCTDYQTAEEFVRLMLSEEVQDFIGAEAYGIPIRKSSAFKSIDIEDPRDALFLTEASKTSAQYNIDSPELCAMINDGIRQILNNSENIKKATRELADAVRIFLNIKKHNNTEKL